MKLVQLDLKNYRCYQQQQTLIIDSLTAIIGKNDIGKSALLEAIDGFFNDSVEEADLSTNADSRAIEISCYFSNFPAEIVLDTTVPTSPLEEGILNSEGLLQVKKVFTFGARKSTAVFLVGNYPTAPELDSLLSKKNPELKLLAEQLGVNIDGFRTQNPPIRRAIRQFIGGERALREIKVDGGLGTEDNLKSIWSALKKQLPVFSLFKNDKPFDDKDGDIKNPLQAAIDEALALPEVIEKISEIEDMVKTFSTDIADRTIQKLKNFDASLSERLKSEFNKAPNYGKIFDLTLLNENNIPLNKRGSGIRRLVVLSFFQAQAEKRKIEDGAPAIIYAIEEPETSQHPNHQQMIIDALCELGGQENVQVLFTTHSANLVREIPIEALRYISLTDDAGLQIQYGVDRDTNEHNDAVIQKIIATLGILPNPLDRVKVLLYVEGNNDVSALKRYSKILSDHDNSLINLQIAEEVAYVLTGGSSLKHYVEQRHLDGLGKSAIHIYDSDVPEYVNIVNRINGEGNPNTIGFNTIKLELENYLHEEAIMEAYAQNGNQVVVPPITDQMDVPLEISRIFNITNANNWDQLSDSEKKEIANKKKRFLNTDAVEHMTVTRLQERNGYEEIKAWLVKIQELIVAAH